MFTKEEITRIRRLDPAGVQAALIAAGDLPMNVAIPSRAGNLRPVENAIDMVAWAKKCNFNEATSWLHEHFADDRSQERNVNIKPVERPLSPAEYTINQQVRRQMDALGCSEARLTLMFQSKNEKTQDAKVDLDIAADGDEMETDPAHKNNGKEKKKFGYLIGKRTVDGEKVEKFFNKKDIQNAVGMLKMKNSIDEGMNILMTPMDNHSFYIMIDDARPRDTSTESAVESWKRAGYRPCLGLQTSWSSHQIVFRVPREPFRFPDVKSDNIDEQFDRKGLNAFFTSLNKETGDHRISGLRHGIRLAGYRNMKEKHGRDVEGKAWNREFPFVSIEHTEAVFCEKTLKDALKFCSPEVVGNRQSRQVNQAPVDASVKAPILKPAKAPARMIFTPSRQVISSRPVQSPPIRPVETGSSRRVTPPSDQTIPTHRNRKIVPAPPRHPRPKSALARHIEVTRAQKERAVRPPTAGHSISR